MSQHYYADGAIHIDHHKEMNLTAETIPGNIIEVSKRFFADSVDAEDTTFENFSENTLIRETPENDEHPELNNYTFHVEKTVNGKVRQIDMWKLNLFIKEHFVERIVNQYDWAGLYLFLFEKGLMSSYSPASFETQMNEWYSNCYKKCVGSDVSRYFSKLQNYKVCDWISVFSDDSKVHRLKKVYEDLEDNFDYNKVLF